MTSEARVSNRRQHGVDLCCGPSTPFTTSGQVRFTLRADANADCRCVTLMPPRFHERRTCHLSVCSVEVVRRQSRAHAIRISQAHCSRFNQSSHVPGLALNPAMPCRQSACGRASARRGLPE